MQKEIKQAIKNTISNPELFKHLKLFHQEEVNSLDIDIINKQVKKINKYPSVKIAYVGNYTIEPLPAYVCALSAIECMIVGEYVGNYNQYFQELLNTNSGLIQYKPDIIYLALSVRQFSPEVYYQFSSLSIDKRKEYLNYIISHISDWVKITLNNTNATLLLSNFVRPNFHTAGIADIHQEYGESEFYFELNLALIRLFRNESRVHIFDIDRLASRFGKSQAYDSKMYYLAKMEWKEQFISVIAQEIIRYIKASQNLAKKCLVLDLDNTLWGGIVGEDGVGNIKIGYGDPVGEAFLEFQHKIKAIKDRGIILCLCSKNNLEDALEVFEKRPEMPLKKNDFSVMEINWNPKHENIKKIAKSLNIGTDSIVFIDDNPAECSLVSQMIPEVKTILLPSNPVDYPKIIDQIDYFEKLHILQDDVQKSTQYLQNQQREDAKNKIGDLRSYLKSLETVITIRQATRDDLPRVHQLFAKTNQFNLTTIRYSIGEVEQFLQNTNYDLTVISARDKFGKLGTIALYLLKFDKNNIEIDSLVMSCRAMGRGVETAVINYIKTKYLVGKNPLSIIAKYIPSQKNKPVEYFLDKQGFSLLEEQTNGTKNYLIQTDNVNLLDCSWIQVVS